MSPLSNRGEVVPSTGKLDIKIGRQALSIQYYRQALLSKEWSLGSGGVFDESKVVSGTVLSAIEEINILVGRSSPEIRLIFPDPYVDHRLVVTDNLPKNKRKRSEFIKWILKDQYFLNSDDRAIDYSVVNDNGKYLISVFSIGNEWLSLVSEFDKRNLLIGSICPEMLAHISRLKIPSSGYFVYQGDSFIGSTLIDVSGSIRVHGGKFFNTYDIEGQIELLKRIKRDYLSLHENGGSTKDLQPHVICPGSNKGMIESVFSNANYTCYGNGNG